MVEWYTSGWQRGAPPPMICCCVRSDDLKRLERGTESGGFNLGTGLVVFDNVPRLRA